MKVRGVTSAIAALEAFREGWTEDSRWMVGVGVNYGAYVEFGTSRMAAQPYLFPAARTVMRSQFPTIAAQASSLDECVEATALAIEAEAKRNAPVDTGNLRASIRAFPAEGWA